MNEDSTMIMTETPAAAPKPAKKKARKPQRRVAKAEPVTPVPAEFAGLSTTDCCDACNKEYCAVSGKGYCAHPMKGGLQAAQMQDNDALKRFNRAKGALRNQQIDLRGR